MIHTMTGATTQYQRRNQMPKFKVNYIDSQHQLEATNESDAFDEMVIEAERPLERDRRYE